MVNAARSRMREIGGPPNAAAARVLYELTAEEDLISTDDYNDPTNGDTFGALVAATDSPEDDNEDQNYFETLAAEEKDDKPDQDFHLAGEQD